MASAGKGLAISIFATLTPTCLKTFLRAAWRHEPPTLERAAHGRELPPIAAGIGSHVHDRETRLAQQRDAERVRERALARRREVGRMHDGLYEWDVGVTHRGTALSANRRRRASAFFAKRSA
jgi:hypothetical protein